MAAALYPQFVLLFYDMYTGNSNIKRDCGSFVHMCRNGTETMERFVFREKNVITGFKHVLILLHLQRAVNVPHHGGNNSKIVIGVEQYLI